MADTAREKDDFVNATTGLFKDNTTGDITPQDLRDFVETMHPPYGSLYFSSPSETSPGTAGVYLKAAGTTTSVSLRKFSHSNNRLTYTGVPDVHVHIACSLTMDTAGSNKTIGFKIAKNGTVLDHSEVKRKVGASGDIGSTALHADVMLSTNDYLELWVANMDDTTGVTVETGYLFALGMFI